MSGELLREILQWVVVIVWSLWAIRITRLMNRQAELHVRLAENQQELARAFSEMFEPHAVFEREEPDEED